MENEPHLTPEQVATIEKAFQEGIEEVDKEDAQHVLAKEPKARKKAEALLQQGGSLVRLGRQIILLYDLLKDWWAGTFPLPWKIIAAVVAALLYFINPFDIVPDFIPLIGYLDDAVVVGACIRLIRSNLRDYADKKQLPMDHYGLD